MSKQKRKGKGKGKAKAKAKGRGKAKGTGQGNERHSAAPNRADPRPALSDLPPEERRAEVATVGWMMTTLTTMLAFTLGAIVWGITASQAETPIQLAVLRGLLLTTAAVSGLVTLLMTLVVLRMRAVAPPRSITVSAVTVGLGGIALAVAAALS